ncbi:unnamed protein product [Ilex paraguariensis]|uniref:Uncharacterized protein n=1 Tax=Ilex paraguariensis TaxID=185542 RepID=A0ABC8SSP0_9AQUA
MATYGRTRTIFIIVTVIATILVVSIFMTTYDRKESTSYDNGGGPGDGESTVEYCVKHHSGNPPPPNHKEGWRSEYYYIVCRDVFRNIGLSYQVSGILPPDYVKAMKNVPEFKNNETALNAFFCGLAATYRGVRC